MLNQIWSEICGSTIKKWRARDIICKIACSLRECFGNDIIDWALVKCINDSGCGPVAGLRVLLNQNLRYIHTPGVRPA
jgi:hypothetical protein